MQRIHIQIEQRTRKIVGEGLYEKNLVKVINCRVISVVAYMMNVCNFTGKELDQLDKGIIKIFRENNMHGKQCSDEKLYLRRELGGRGLKSLKNVYAETKLRVACYMTFSSSLWIKETWKREVNLKGKSIKKEAEEALKEINVNVEFREDGVWLERQQLEGKWKGIWKTLKHLMEVKSENCKLKKYKDKKMQCEVYEKLDEESHRWLQCNIEPKKVASIIAVQEQMVETRTLKANR